MFGDVCIRLTSDNEHGIGVQIRFGHCLSIAGQAIVRRHHAWRTSDVADPPMSERCKVRRKKVRGVNALGVHLIGGEFGTAVEEDDTRMLLE
ncbi:MAG TPA: hypothetical protein VFG00_10670 [Acidothermaceae bacterium]|nr:hypothetical protein [Acidothermaceae bacterium]